LEHLVYNPKTLIREIHRILKPNGEVVVSTPNVARIENRIKALIGWNVYPRLEEFYFSDLYKRHNREYTLLEVEDLFCPPFKLRTARYIMPYEFAIPVSNKGRVYDSREYAEIVGGRPQSKTPLSALSLGRRAFRWCKSVYPPFRSCLLLSFIAQK
jgi:SAM-dependent methyltransferase